MVSQTSSTADIVGLMAKKKTETEPFSIRLPRTVIAELDAVAESKFEKRAGMVARIVIEWLEKNRPAHTPANKRKN